MEYIILGAGILSLLIGIFSLLAVDFSRKTFSFAFFCFVSSIWIFLNFLLYHLNEGYILKLVYASGILMPAAVLSWTYTYLGKGNRIWKHILIYSVGCCIAAIALFTDKIVEEVMSITPTGIIIREGSLFYLFSIFNSFTSLFAVIRISIFFKRSVGQKRKQIRLILIGIGLFSITCVLVSVILPAFGIFSVTNLDSPSALFFIIFTSIAIIKYNFLDIKLALAQLLSAIIISISAFEVFYAGSKQELILRLIALLFVLSVGVFLIRTVKQEAQKKEDLELANAKLMKIDKMKSEFISMAAHQLRTPLTTMKGFISIMKKGVYGKIPVKLNEPVRYIETANDRLILLVEDMLNVSQIEAGRMSFNLKEESLNELAEEIFHSFSPMAKEKNLYLDLEKGKRLPKIMMDYGKMRETISNIVDNAIKYTESGGVKIETKKKGDVLQVIIIDTGIGIDKDGFDFLFDKFSRGKEAQQIKKNGVGLGLYLGKKIVEAHYGNIVAKSGGRGRGSVFIINLPILKK